MPRSRYLALTVVLVLPCLGYVLGTGDRLGLACAGEPFVAHASIAIDDDVPATPKSSDGQDTVAPAGVGQTTSDSATGETASSPVCDVPNAKKISTITLEETGVSATCIVLGAGDLLTWVNSTSTPVEIRTTDDLFYTQDVSQRFSSLHVPAYGQMTVRLNHAGRVAYAGPLRSQIRGTILVLGRGAS